MSDTSDPNSPMPKRKRHDSSTDQQQQQIVSDEQDAIIIKTECQESSLEIIDVYDRTNASPPSSPPPQLSPPCKNTELKINDLAAKLLVKIFEWLDFPDLLNAANATKKLRDAAGLIYVRKYADKLVKFHGNADALRIDETLSTFEINDTRTCLLMFRAFGDFIAKLHLNFDGIGRRRTQAISQALNDYCAKSLNELECHHTQEGSITGKFPKLTILRVKNGILGKQLAQFNEMFPLLHVLELSKIITEHRKCIERTFPKLLHLTVHIEMQKGMDFLKSNVKAAVQLNPQLRSLCLGSGCDAILLPYINNMLPLLNHLEIREPRNKLFDSAIEPVQFERVRNLTLDIAQSKDSFSNIPFSFNRLEKFELNAAKQHRDKWIDFITTHSRLVELHLMNFDWFYVVSAGQLGRIAKLPKLAILVLDWNINDTAAFVKLMNDCSSLQEIRLTTRTQDQRTEICSKLKAGWYMQIDRNILTLQRTNDADEIIGHQSN